MSEVILVRHAQASFGAADYDVLSELGRRQSRTLGEALRGQEVSAAFVGRQRRHRETWEGIAAELGLEREPRVHPGLDEFDFAGLLSASGREEARTAPRAAHFRALRDAVLAWQRGEVEDPPETWDAFATRVAEAREVLVAAAPSIAVSSGGAIAQMVAMTLRAPPDRMIELQLQMRNCAVSRLIAGRRDVYLHSFNEGSRVPAEAHLVTYA